jgi:hypothetical protein
VPLSTKNGKIVPENVLEAPKIIDPALAIFVQGP